jgi:biopolymer transport protein ExbB
VASQLLDAFSGPAAVFMYAITAVLAYTLAVSVERFYRFSRWKPPTGDVLGQLKSSENQAGALLNLKHHPSHAILEAGLSAQTADQAWNAMSAAATLTEGQIQKRIASLATAGNVATMLGLLGTVYGLIFALDGLDQASAVERTAQLSQGIAAAMITTAYGLIVGMPALIAHRSFSSKADALLRYCEAAAATLASTKP